MILRYLKVFVLPLLLLLSGCSSESADSSRNSTRSRPPVPVEVELVTSGSFESVKFFSGSLYSPLSYTVAPEVSGRLLNMPFQLGDPVKPGDLLTSLDPNAQLLALEEARAAVAVARASLKAAQNALQISTREIARLSTLRERGVASEAQFDAAEAGRLANLARIALAEAEIAREEAALQSAELRLSYTRLVLPPLAPSSESASTLPSFFIAARHREPGDPVAPGEPIYTIVQLDPLRAVFFVSERDYFQLSRGMSVLLATDAFPDQTFAATIDRIAPVFDDASRQARVEALVPNSDLQLRPGLFVRLGVSLDRLDQANIVPREALTRRNGQDGVFALRSDRQSVAWQPVTLLLESEGAAAIEGVEAGTSVVVLGKQFLSDGAAIFLPVSAPRL